MKDRIGAFTFFYAFKNTYVVDFIGGLKSTPLKQKNQITACAVMAGNECGNDEGKER